MHAAINGATEAEFLARSPLENEPGTKYDYSNYGAGLLGHALAKAAGAKSFEEALVQRVCGPLALKDTRVRLSAEHAARLAPGFNKKGKPAEHWRFALLESCGGLFSTAGDQVQFIAANLGVTESLLLAAMKDSQRMRRDADEPGRRVGLCWHTIPLSAGSKRSIVWHNGGTGAARCFLGFVPDAKIGVVILTNFERSVDGPAIELLQKLVAE